MIAQLRGLLERAEFDVIEAAVRYCEEIASLDELAALLVRLEDLRAVGTSRAQEERELFAFPRYLEPRAWTDGH